ncbi:putative reverse transcriptase zinc-binding domain-containing protein [Helianthus annuus]|uniref:Reverse transcriptase zinc-binding domain-containing protein n=1 Tax=Helianthus annuus TaxID=4232 RepID=A0A9K3IPX8_HELAN|nr:uncharacterized protein LOC110944303 [Helianthus annuus]KAF5800838.1 putative reverse transcriptase zinc-binding domain-containing protein [Helianthus annuus]
MDRVKIVDSVQVFEWSWIADHVPAEAAEELQQLSILLTGVQMSKQEDRWFWSASSEGVFSVKALKRLLFDEHRLGQVFILDWCKWVPAKCNILAWRLEMGKIATREALIKRQIHVEDSVCPLCNSEEESADHLFISCYVASVIWNAVSSWCKIPCIFAFSIKDLFGVHSNLKVSERKKEAVQGFILIVCWSIWRARNNLVFSNKPVKIDCIVSEVKVLGFLWFKNRSRFKSLDWKEWVSFVNM